MPINGGTITVLDQTTPNTPTAGIALQNERIIYADVTAIRFVPTAGATTSPLVRTIAEEPTTVTTINANSSHIYWGVRNGAVRERSGSTTVTLQSSNSRLTTSIAADGSKIAW